MSVLVPNLEYVSLQYSLLKPTYQYRLRKSLGILVTPKNNEFLTLTEDIPDFQFDPV